MSQLTEDISLSAPLSKVAVKTTLRNLGYVTDTIRDFLTFAECNTPHFMSPVNGPVYVAYLGDGKYSIQVNRKCDT